MKEKMKNVKDYLNLVFGDTKQTGMFHPAEPESSIYTISIDGYIIQFIKGQIESTEWRIFRP
jgi:hypothetical protein